MTGALLALLLAQPFGGAFGSPGPVAASATVRRATVAAYGDSLTAGACSGTAPPAALDALLPTGYVVVNLGASGETAHQIAARVLEGAATACVGEPCGTYVLEGGVNTLKSATYAASAAETVAAVALEGDGGSDGADDRGMIDAADFLRATYPTAQVLLVGVLPYAGCDVATCPSLVQPAARASAYNTALLTACASRPWLTCILPYAALEDPSQPDYLLPAYACADGIHLVNAGSAALAASIYSTGSW